MKLLHIQKRDNVELYLCCKFQLSPFSVRSKTDVTDGVTNNQTNELPYAVAPPLGIISKIFAMDPASREGKSAYLAKSSCKSNIARRKVL